MALQQEQHVIKGMQRDLTISKFSPEFAFDCQNIRITARDNNTLLSVTNERGTDLVELKGTDNNTFTLQGVTIGYCVLNKYLVLFNTTNVTDYIYRLEPKNGYFECVQLFTGSLNFSTSAPIETLGNYETEDIQKVYWVDGVNQPRVINIMSTPVTESNLYDFKLTVTLPTVTINKEYGAGEFPSGTIQYAVSYYRRYGQQTPLIYISDLQYLTFEDRAGSPEENVNCYFTIKLSNLDSDYDYVRLYSIVRTSIDSTPTVKLIGEQNISLDGCIFTDYGTLGESIDPSTLLYIGGQNIIASTICSKDNTLFFGNITLNDYILTEDIKSFIKDNSNVTFKRRVINKNTKIGLYNYISRLDESSGNLKHFKGGEIYRIGVQFQDNYGNYTQPVYLGDFKNTLYPYSTNTEYYLPYIEATINIPESLNGFSARLVMAQPTSSDRSIIAQGVLCSTVFNSEDRVYDSPYAQSSWFTRPMNLSSSTKFASHHWSPIHNEIQVDFNQDSHTVPTKDVVISYDTTTYTMSWVVNFVEGGGGVSYDVTLESDKEGTLIDNVNYTSWDNVVLDVTQKGISLAKVPSTPTQSGNTKITMTTQESKRPVITDYVNSYDYYVDCNLVNLLTPEIINNTNNLQNVKLRIVGYTAVSNILSDYSINSTVGWDSSISRTLNKNFSGPPTTDIFGYFLAGYITAYPLYRDRKEGEEQIRDYWVYPWHRSGSLNGDDVKEATSESVRTAILQRKVISNLWYFNNYSLLNSSSTIGENGIWESFSESDGNKNGISDVAYVGDTDNISVTRIETSDPLYSTSDYYTYYNNTDKIVTVSSKESESKYDIYYTSGDSYSEGSYPGYSSDETGTDPVNVKYKSGAHYVFAFKPTDTGLQVVLPRFNDDEEIYTISGIPVWVSASIERLSYYVSNIQEITTPNLGAYGYDTTRNALYVYGLSENGVPYWSEDTISPAGSLFITEDKTVYITSIAEDGRRVLTQSTGGVYYPELKQNSYTNNYLYIGELYKDIDLETIYGGNSEAAISSNIWIPIGDTIKISGTSFTLDGHEGDTYFQRYDHLKTYSFTEEDQNSIIDIASFMVETHINIDGRYDRNRGLENNLSINPTNFNLFNSVYSQSNNYFTYRILDEQYNQNYFPTTVTWSNEKQIGEIIDTWLDVNLGSSLVVDGDKGKIVSLNTFNNEIYCFQERGLSNILFNSRVQIPASDGVPIEITNGLKVSGKRYVSNSIGCSNKWSIAESPSGLYFVDNETNSIYLFNGQIQSLSDKLGLRQWISENNSNNEWDPVDYGNFRTFYDKNNNDVYFTNSSTSLCYSELLGQFTSFMSYEKVSAMFNIGSEFYSIKDSQLWHNFSGDYNMFYGIFKPYSVTIVANSNEPYDKVFNTIEFRADSWNGDTLINNQTFDTLDVWNEYQHGTSTLTNVIGKPSPLKKKFRVWRANIPRDNSNKMDRIRNTWAYVKLSMNTQNTWRTELHDIMVHYFM